MSKSLHVGSRRHFFFGQCFLILLSGFEVLKVAKIYDKNEVNPTFMAEEEYGVEREAGNRCGLCSFKT